MALEVALDRRGGVDHVEIVGGEVDDARSRVQPFDVGNEDDRYAGFDEHDVGILKPFPWYRRHHHAVGAEQRRLEQPEPRVSHVEGMPGCLPKIAFHAVIHHGAVGLTRKALPRVAAMLRQT
jgi:hypothetical protein